MHHDENVVMDFVPDYAHKVMENLLSNALKFTHAFGQIDVYVVRVGNILHIDVNDTGDGMDKETMDNVFKAFYQGPSDSQNMGTGVGLSLVKHIIESVHGTISVESQVGKGTKFHMEIAITNNCDVQLEEKDMEFDPVMPVEQKELKDSDAKDIQYTALVIEDNHDIAAFISGQLAGGVFGGLRYERQRRTAKGKRHRARHYHYRHYDARNGRTGIVSQDKKQQGYKPYTYYNSNSQGFGAGTH